MIMKLIQYIWKTSVLKIWSIKFATFILVMFMVCFRYNKPVRDFAAKVNWPVSWCVFPFLMSQFSFLILFWFGIIYINTDVPFKQYINMYQIIRTGRKRWIAGQIGGIVIRSFLAVFLASIMSALTLYPHIEFTNDWGKGLRTLATENTVEGFNYYYRIYYDIFGEFTPVQLMLLTIIISILISVLLGILMFFLSLLLSRAVSVASVMIFVIAIFWVINSNPSYRFKVACFVPAVWAEVARIATPDLGYYWLPSLSYIFLVLLSSNFVLGAVLVYQVKNIEFDWENGDI